MFIIGESNSDRLEYFRNNQEMSKLLKPVYLEAVMLSNQQLPELISEEVSNFQKVLYDRALFAAEVGCASSHKNVYSQVADSSNGALIFEDDARINDFAKLIEETEYFLNKYKNKAAVLSFFDGRPWSKIQYSFVQRHPIIRVFGSTAHTVCYALTPEAARVFQEANKDLRFVADWPFSNSIFFVSTLSLVSHGDPKTISIIDPSGKRVIRPKLSRRVKILTSIFFFQNQKTFRTFSLFFRIMWLPRLHNHLNKFFFRLIILAYSEPRK